ncbi:V-type ATP synthase subunit F [Streptomyces sp. HPF1205]|uniref:V-type ATP synthase subunit F n=1 Tax=Streptomyces sp. HPF1205 TaxID=2873262 RepID=UPI001CEDAB88|nr:V-type ATP synthase subunit F [Streptomyces sp. HPF1205]
MTGGAVVAIGERTRVSGFALAGVEVLVAERPEAVRQAWDGLPAGVGLVIVTPAAAAALGAPAPDRESPLVVVMPP